MKKLLISSACILNFYTIYSMEIPDRYIHWQYIHGGGELRNSEIEKIIEEAKAQQDRDYEESQKLYKELEQTDRNLWNDIRATGNPELLEVFRTTNTVCSVSPERIQLLASRAEFKEFFDRFNAIKIMWENYSEKLQQQKQKDEEREKSIELAKVRAEEQAKSLLHRQLEQEIYMSSRNLTEQELKDVSPLMSIIAKKHGIDEVRIIDAQSLIEFTELPSDEKKRLLDLLNSGENIEEEIHHFIDKSAFFDTPDIDTPDNPRSIRSNVTKSLVRMAASSPIYRAEILTLIAWSRATKQTLYDVQANGHLTDRPNRQIEFCASPKSSHTYNKIRTKIHGISFEEHNKINMNFFYKLFIYAISNNSPNHIAIYSDPIDGILSHEIGHQISGNIGSVIDTYEDSIQKSMAIAAEFTTLEKDEEMFTEAQAMITTMPEEQFLTIKEELNKKFTIKGISLMIKDRNELLSLSQSESFFARNLFHNIPELMQILGFFTHTHEGKQVFYLNKFSDAASRSFAGLPICTDHMGGDIDRIKAAKTSTSAESVREHEHPSDILTQAFIVKKANLNSYGALVSAFGVNPEEYFKRISRIKSIDIDEE